MTLLPRANMSYNKRVDCEKQKGSVLLCVVAKSRFIAACSASGVHLVQAEDFISSFSFCAPCKCIISIGVGQQAEQLSKLALPAAPVCL